MTGRRKVLLGDYDEALIKIVKPRIKQLNVDVVTATDGFDAMMHLVDEKPDLVILNMDMPAADGTSLGDKLASKAGNIGSAPMIFLADKDDQKSIAHCKQIGADLVLKDAKIWKNLKPKICRTLGIETAQPALKTPEKPEKPATLPASDMAPPDADEERAAMLLAVDDDKDILRALKLRIEATGMEFIQATSPQVGYNLALKHRPDVIITDYHMPEGSALYLVQRLRNCPATIDIPVIVLTGQTFDGENKDLALMRRMTSQDGVVAYMQKPIDFTRLYSVLNQYVELPPKFVQSTAHSNVAYAQNSHLNRRTFGQRR
ncbi:MAG: response regulator [Pseudomonadota bacterium]